MSENKIQSKENIVLVTGFGANHNAPYGNASTNPAGAVARMLPTVLHADDPLNISGHEVKILDPVAGGFAAITAQLGTIRDRIRELHAEHGDKVRLWIHLGRGPWEFVTCERYAFRQDFSSSWLTADEHEAYYLSPDNAKQNVRDLGPCPWVQVPMGLNSELDIDAVVAGANQGLASPSRRPHNVGNARSAAHQDPLQVVSHFEAGAYGCGFAYYESMANCFAAGRRRDVLFCHVPRHEDQATLDKDVDAILAIIGASIAALDERERNPPPEPPSAEWKVQFGQMR